MRRRRMPDIANGRLIVGLALSVIGLGGVAAVLADLSALVEPRAVMRAAPPLASARKVAQSVDQSACSCGMAHHHRGDHRAPGAVVPDPLLARPAPSADRRRERNGLRGQGDVRAFLRDAAAVARRYPWAAPWRGETRTELWVNAPTSIGSTSPP